MFSIWSTYSIRLYYFRFPKLTHNYCISKFSGQLVDVFSLVVLNWLFCFFFQLACPKYLPGGNGMASTPNLSDSLLLSWPNSLLVYFPEAVYRNVGSSVVLPQLLALVDRDKLVIIQFLLVGSARLTFKDIVSCNDFISCGLVFNGSELRIVLADNRFRSVFPFDLPTEVTDDDVKTFFGSFGGVLSTRRSTFPNFPSVCNGNRVLGA